MSFLLTDVKSIERIDKRILADLSKHTRRLGFMRFVRSIGYERCAELPLVIQHLKPMFAQPIKHLDIGSGDSVLPTYILRNSAWDVTCLDKFSSVRVQHTYARRALTNKKGIDRLHVIEKDFLQQNLPEASFDVITNISVIEHFDNRKDMMAMEQSASLLKRGGKYLLTTLINDGHFKEFFLEESVYGNKYSTTPVFFQRHYDVASFDERIVRASGLKEAYRVYFGEYGFQFLDRFIDIAWPLKPVKTLYQWATPLFAHRYITYNDAPVSRANMRMYTASGVFVVLEKPS